MKLHSCKGVPAGWQILMIPREPGERPRTARLERIVYKLADGTMKVRKVHELSFCPWCGANLVSDAKDPVAKLERAVARGRNEIDDLRARLTRIAQYLRAGDDEGSFDESLARPDGRCSPDARGLAPGARGRDRGGPGAL